MTIDSQGEILHKKKKSETANELKMVKSQRKLFSKKTLSKGRVHCNMFTHNFSCFQTEMPSGEAKSHKITYKQ